MVVIIWRGQWLLEDVRQWEYEASAYRNNDRKIQGNMRLGCLYLEKLYM
jgi:hypothetical protein